MKVAIVHEWLVTRAGSEKVVEEILGLFPDADLFTLICALPPGQDGMIRGRKVTTSFLQHLWGAKTRRRAFMPLMPIAAEQFDVSGYDLVISSSHAVGKGVITGPNQVHISYIHSPMRYAWDLQHTYLAESGLARGFRSALARHVATTFSVATMVDSTLSASSEALTNLCGAAAPAPGEAS